MESQLLHNSLIYFTLTISCFSSAASIIDEVFETTSLEAIIDGKLPEGIDETTDEVLVSSTCETIGPGKNPKLEEEVKVDTSAAPIDVEAESFE